MVIENQSSSSYNVINFSYTRTDAPGRTAEPNLRGGTFLGRLKTDSSPMQIVFCPN
ncbi:hypothetical protein RMSM_01438 [Rhodopirellula maiorica SM1]|uniref:Uncharacterized protein n=1 Tax=Rhodopirellula maiorica SM1 TaxID=1265738 RepID=M5S619_9BACT|nr:hypothetical protein RMSM_01438 [Rhodopirellula maiorica SM1]